MEFNADAIIAEATKVAESAPASTEAKTETPTQAKEPEKVESKEGDDPAKPKPDAELSAEQLVKREANRQSHLNSKLAKMRRELREAKELNVKLQTPQAQAPTAQSPKTPDGPKEEDYQNYGEYLEARAEWKAEQKIDQKLAERDTKTTETAKTQEVNAQKVTRINEIANQEQEFAKANPEYTALYNEHADFMGNIPLPVAEALMEADNASLALFALMKEGKLESLEDMSPFKISMEIGKAEIRGESYLNQNKATNAPAPIEAARGTGTASKSMADMGVEELMKKFNSR